VELCPVRIPAFGLWAIGRGLVRAGLHPDRSAPGGGHFCHRLVCDEHGVFQRAELERATTRSVDERAPLNQAWTVLRRDLRGAVPPQTNSYLLPRDFVVTGNSGRLAAAQAGTLEFYTTTGRLNVLDPWGEVQRVRYELVAPADHPGAGPGTGAVVTRNILATTTAEETEEFLFGNVESLEFQCFDGSTWVSAWDTTAFDEGLPQAIRVRLLLVSPHPEASRLLREPLELVVPLLAQILTNQPTGGTL
jgi:hypothetical protein